MMVVNRTSLREIVANQLDKMAYSNERIVILNADLMKSSRTGTFVKHHPEKSFNVGVAEQNMVSFAAGLAHEGFIPFVFSMSPFLSMRACEQCRTDVAYADLNVRLMGSYSGVSGGISGATHWGVEDVGIMTTIPNMTVVELSDATQTECLLEESLLYHGPIYFRITVEPVEEIYKNNSTFEIGKASIARNGVDGAIICSGVTVTYALKAAEEISKEIRKEIQVIDMYTIKPIDREKVVSAAKTGTILVIQDHNIIGGLGQQVADVLAEEGLNCRFQKIGIPDRFDAMAHASFLYRQYGYDKEGIKKNMINLLNRAI